jgi:hypothetical protein
MSYLKNEVAIIVYFADERYAQHGSMLTIRGYGKGSSLSVAINRAFRDVLKNPQAFHKSPNHIYLSVGADGSEPIDLLQRLPEESFKKLRCSGFFG